MFLGEFECSIDRKGRLFLPAHFRRYLKGDPVITLIDKDTIIVSDSAGWSPDIVLSNVLLPPEKLQLFLKYITLKSVVVRCDSQGRIVIPTSFFEKTSLSSECMAVGNVNTILILNKIKFLEEKENIFNDADVFIMSEEGSNVRKALLFK